MPEVVPHDGFEVAYAKLADERGRRLRMAVRAGGLDALLLTGAANVAYATGYRSVGQGVFDAYPVAALVRPERTLLVAPCADSAPAMEAGVAEDDIVPFGTFYFESTGDPHPATHMWGRHDTFNDALDEALGTLPSVSRVGFDVPDGPGRAAIERAGQQDVDSSAQAYRVRAAKSPGEIERLARAAELAEAGIDAALKAARAGVSEAELAAVVASTMAANGGEPRFVVVTSGPRSALADARPSDRRLEAGDLLRFDVGCLVEGYWSDIGRTAVLGPADRLQSERYGAILAGETAQLERVHAGMRAGELFEIAIAEVEAAGLSPYRRHHCGHAIGTEVYERPVIAADDETVLEVGMTFCVETPFYELGWGGMMVEDTIVITEDGCAMLSQSPRKLRVVDP